MDFLPVFLNIRSQSVLVVGGGNVAARKVSLLLKAGARVHVVAKKVCSDLLAYKRANQITLDIRQFNESDIIGRVMIVASTNDQELNQHIARRAQDNNILVNVVDNANVGNFIFPSIVDRSPIQVAVSTGGASPVLGRMLRAKLESSIPAAYGRLAELVEKHRSHVKKKFDTVDMRRRFWERVMQSPVAELVLAGQEQAATALLEKMLAESDRNQTNQGEVYLVGAGPGDPDLLTFRALRLMQQADVVVYDRLVSPPILDLVRREADRIYAGKERANHALPQENINDLLVRLAQEGKRVLRLKGGDPFIFGRGGEEISMLIDHKIPFQVVPGITAASGCAAYAGIPLTHRDYAQACIFVTGHLKDGTVDLNWEMLAHDRQTLIYYMGLHGLSMICTKLIEHGLPTTTPAALITQGTTPQQEVLIGDLSTLPTLVEARHAKAPTIIIVGEVVKLHEKLKWFNPAGDVDAQGVTTYGVSQKTL